jgi:hypothetical protein
MDVRTGNFSLTRATRRKARSTDLKAPSSWCWSDFLASRPLPAIQSLTMGNVDFALSREQRARV